MKNNIVKLGCIVLFSGMMVACSNLPGMNKTDIRQGNSFDKARLDRIQQGMPQSEVQRILGTPLVEDVFHPNIWYYTYLHTLSNGKEVEQSNVRVIFDKNKKVIRVERG